MPSLNTTDDPRVIVVMGVLLLVVGVGLTAFAVMEYQSQVNALDNADEVEATIVDSEVLLYDDGFDSTGTDDRDPDEREYRKHVEFEYEYEGQQYRSTNIDIAGTTERYDEREDAETALAEYPEGGQVTAYVDPDDPDEAFLEAGVPTTTYLLIGFGAFLIVGAVVMAAVYVRMQRKQQSQNR